VTRPFVSSGASIPSDRISGRAFSQAEIRLIVRRVQTALTVRGYDSGGIDGVLGDRTRSSLRAFQTARGLRVTGFLDLETLDALGVTTAEPSLGAAPVPERPYDAPAGAAVAPAPVPQAPEVGPATSPLAVARPAVPAWVDQPSSADLDRLRPSAAGGRAGVAIVRCRVQDDGTLVECVSISETPSGSRYGQAAVRASALYRMRVDGAWGGFVGEQIDVPVTWHAR